MAESPRVKLLACRVNDIRLSYTASLCCYFVDPSIGPQDSNPKTVNGCDDCQTFAEDNLQGLL